MTVETPSGDRARVSVFVAVPPADAFDVFTNEVDLWWKTGPKYRIGGKERGKIYFEPRLGGGLFESFDGAKGPTTFRVGEITAWEPPNRLELVWRGVNFQGDESTTVEVRFEASGRGTLVVLEHRGFSSLPDGHPARHGKVGAEFSRMLGIHWGELMTAMREHLTHTGRS